MKRIIPIFLIASTSCCFAYQGNLPLVITDIQDYFVLDPNMKTNDFNYQYVDQGTYGDCWLMATLAELSYQNYELLESNVQTLPSGDWNVVVYNSNQVAQTIHVDYNEVYGTYGAIAEQDANQFVVWPKVYETAFLHVNPNAVLYGYMPSFALSTLTDNPAVDKYIPQLQQDQMLESLLSQTNDHFPMMASTSDPNDPNIVSDHAYSVFAYDQNTQLVTVRNPWGEFAPHDGVQQLTLSDFTQNFVVLTMFEFQYQSLENVNYE